MAFYTGIDCPVCGKPLQDGEDIVTCPVCGTPSHRHCYEAAGGCVNKDKHAAGYTFETSRAKKEEPAQPQAPQAEPTQQAGAAPAQTPPYFTGLGMPMAPGADRYAHSDVKIAGEKIGDMAAVVRTRIPFYMNVFERLDKRAKKFTWNWSALLFGPYWFFFRRMGKMGMLFILIQTIASVLLQAVFTANISQYSALMANAFPGEDTMSLFLAAQPDTIEKLRGIMEQSGVMPYLLASLAALVAIHLVCCMLANRSYLKHCTGLVQRVRAQLEDPEVMERVTSAGYPGKTKTDFLRMYLVQMGGTSFLNVVTGYMGYYLLLILVNYLTM